MTDERLTERSTTDILAEIELLRARRAVARERRLVSTSERGARDPKPRVGSHGKRWRVESVDDDFLSGLEGGEDEDLNKLLE